MMAALHGFDVIAFEGLWQKRAVFSITAVCINPKATDRIRLVPAYLSSSVWNCEISQVRAWLRLSGVDGEGVDALAGCHRRLCGCPVPRQKQICQGRLRHG